MPGPVVGGIDSLTIYDGDREVIRFDRVDVEPEEGVSMATRNEALEDHITEALRKIVRTHLPAITNAIRDADGQPAAIALAVKWKPEKDDEGLPTGAYALHVEGKATVPAMPSVAKVRMESGQLRLF
jgi:hypothetical protein